MTLDAAKMSLTERSIGTKAQKTDDISSAYSVVVSSENTSYLGWQTKLFCFSSISRLGITPTVIVHGSGPLRAEFALLKRYGCQVIQAPSYRRHPRRDYPARNEVGSLSTLSSLWALSNPILFCEPDMLFVRPVTYGAALSGNCYKYLDYSEPRITTTASKFGIRHLIPRLNERYKVGVPYLIPGHQLQAIARRWLEVLDAFDTVEWIDIMYAFGLSLVLEGLDIETTHVVDDNSDARRALSGSVIHYCYGDDVWNKRDYFKGCTPFDVGDAQLPEAKPATILNEIISQIREAKRFFGPG